MNYLKSATKRSNGIKTLPAASDKDSTKNFKNVPILMRNK
jgi:hypothetical protein